MVQDVGPSPPGGLFFLPRSANPSPRSARRGPYMIPIFFMRNEAFRFRAIPRCNR
jgi:hypothetical protein